MKCTIGCPVRNVAEYLNYTFNNIKIISSLFDKCDIIFFYDESNDNTLDLINNFKNNNTNINIIINNDPMLYYRTHRIANARNKIIEFIEKNSDIDNDFFILLDCGDECTYKVNTDILNKYLNRDDWDALFFNREGLPCGNYDIWALQFDNFIQNCWSLSEPIEIINIMRNELNTRLNNINNDELLEIYSAFNGFGIYRLNKFFGIRYNGEVQKYFSNEELDNMLKYINDNYNININIANDAKENCEHIGFHINAIRQNGAKIRFSKDCIFNVVKPKVQIYISNNFSKYYLPFFVYRQILYLICEKYISNNIQFIYNIESFDNTKDTVLIMNLYCLHYTLDYDIYTVVKNSIGKVLLINTEFYLHHNVNNILNWINENNLKQCYFLEYNIINYNHIKQNFLNVNLEFAPLIYHTYLEIYYKNEINNNFIKWNNKDIDILFIGRLNDRRMNILDKLKTKYNVHILSGYTGKNENNHMCNLYERSKVVLNILFEDQNSIFDYYRNSLLISNKILTVSEKPKNIDYNIENYLQDIDNNLIQCNYDDFYNTVDNILSNYNENDINNIKEKTYNWFKSRNDMDYFKNFFIRNGFWYNYDV
jgi:hypothetical protein